MVSCLINDPSGFNFLSFILSSVSPFSVKIHARKRTRDGDRKSDQTKGKRKKNPESLSERFLLCFSSSSVLVTSFGKYDLRLFLFSFSSLYQIDLPRAASFCFFGPPHFRGLFCQRMRWFLNTNRLKKVWRIPKVTTFGYFAKGAWESVSSISKWTYTAGDHFQVSVRCLKVNGVKSTLVAPHVQTLWVGDAQNCLQLPFDIPSESEVNRYLFLVPFWMFYFMQSFFFQKQGAVVVSSSFLSS